jgi:hypothetical protein
MVSMLAITNFFASALLATACGGRPLPVKMIFDQKA